MADLEGIELETINPENDEIILPEIEDTEVETTDEGTQADETETSDSSEEGNVVDEKKASLERGINKERSLRKAAERKVRELEKQIQDSQKANKEPEKTTLDTLLESGMDEEIAKSISKVIDKNKPDNSQLEKELADLKFKDSLNAKSKEEGFEDILDYADDIKELVAKGLTIEQSYAVVNYDNSKTINTKSEIERTLEAKMKNNNARKKILGNINSNVGAKVNSTKVKISAEERAIAAAAGMTAEEYAAVRDMNSTKDYSSYQSRKK